MALALDTLGGDQALDLRGLEGVLLALLADLAADHVLSHVILRTEWETCQ